MERTYDSIRQQTHRDWRWILVSDCGPLFEQPKNRQSELARALLADQRVVMLSNSGESGAGNARNYALEWLSEQVESCYLFFIDSGDAWEEQMIEDSLLALWPSTEFNIASGGYEMIWPGGKRKVVCRNGVRERIDMLKEYSTSCLTTSLFIPNTSIFKEIKFGTTMRVNDEPFFFAAVEYFGAVYHFPNVIARYFVGDPKSLSGRKLLSAIGKWKFLREHSGGLIKTLWFFLHYAIYGIIRHIL